MNTQNIAEIFREIASILAIKGENPFRIRAYDRAADSIEGLGQELDKYIKEDTLTTISGIGDDLARQIKEIAASGKSKKLESLKKEVPQGVLDMLKISGLGPKTVHLIYDKLKIKTIDQLAKAAIKGDLSKKLEGVKEKTESNILKGIALFKKGQERTPLYVAQCIAEEFVSQLKKSKDVEMIQVAGSLRRAKDTVRDIDILIVSKKPKQVMDLFVGMPQVKRVLAHGDTKSSVIAGDNDIQVDLRVVEKKSFGSALVYFTGSKQFNINLRHLAIKKGYKVNEYGVFKGENCLASKTEEDIFSLMKMDYIPPELREDRGEIEAAQKGKLPVLVKRKDIKGDLHVHSDYSDGVVTIEEIANYAKKLGYEYIAVTDHSQSLRVANGLDESRVYKKIEEVKRVNKKVKGITVLCGTEVDILTDAKIDYPDKLLKEFDIVVAAIHVAFKQSKAQQTKRLLAACKNKYVHVIAHPTGRLLGERDEYDLDMDELIKAAKDNNKALEINCSYLRLDLNDINSLKAKNSGVKLALGTDAHRLEQYQFMDLGVSVAKRAWLTKKDIINCMKLEDLKKWLKR